MEPLTLPLETTKSLAILSGYAAIGNMDGIVEMWLEIPVESHAAALEVILAMHFVFGIPRMLETLRVIHLPPKKYLEGIDPSRVFYKPQPGKNNTAVPSLVSPDASEQLKRKRINIALVENDDEHETYSYVTAKHAMDKSISIEVPKPLPQTQWKVPFEKIYKFIDRKLISNLNSFHPHIGNTVLNYTYGILLNRNVVELLVTQYVAVAALAAIATKLQLYSHIRGSLLNNGVPQFIKECFAELYNRKILSDESYKLAVDTLTVVQKSLKRAEVKQPASKL